MGTHFRSDFNGAFFTPTPNDVAAFFPVPSGRILLTHKDSDLVCYYTESVDDVLNCRGILLQVLSAYQPYHKSDYIQTSGGLTVGQSEDGVGTRPSEGYFEWCGGSYIALGGQHLTDVVNRLRENGQLITLRTLTEECMRSVDVRVSFKFEEPGADVGIGTLGSLLSPVGIELKASTAGTFKLAGVGPGDLHVSAFAVPFEGAALSAVSGVPVAPAREGGYRLVGGNSASYGDGFMLKDGARVLPQLAGPNTHWAGHPDIASLNGSLYGKVDPFYRGAATVIWSFVPTCYTIGGICDAALSVPELLTIRASTRNAIADALAQTFKTLRYETAIDLPVVSIDGKRIAVDISQRLINVRANTSASDFTDHVSVMTNENSRFIGRQMTVSSDGFPCCGRIKSGGAGYAAPTDRNNLVSAGTDTFVDLDGVGRPMPRTVAGIPTRVLFGFQPACVIKADGYAEGLANQDWQYLVLPALAPPSVGGSPAYPSTNPDGTALTASQVTALDVAVEQVTTDLSAVGYSSAAESMGFFSPAAISYMLRSCLGGEEGAPTFDVVKMKQLVSSWKPTVVGKIAVRV